MPPRLLSTFRSRQHGTVPGSISHLPYCLASAAQLHDAIPVSTTRGGMVSAEFSSFLHRCSSKHCKSKHQVLEAVCMKCAPPPPNHEFLLKWYHTHSLSMAFWLSAWQSVFFWWQLRGKSCEDSFLKSWLCQLCKMLIQFVKIASSLLAVESVKPNLNT